MTTDVMYTTDDVHLVHTDATPLYYKASETPNMTSSTMADITSNMTSDVMSNINATNDTNLMVSIVTSNSLYLTRLVVQTYLVPVVVLGGIIGNIFNIIVLVNPKMRTSTNVYLMSLAICDSMYLLFSLTLAFVHCSNKNQSAISFHYIPYGRVVSDLFGNTAVGLTVCFTLERFIVVRLPMRGKAWCTVKRAKLATLAILIACIINTIPEIFEMKIVESVDSNGVAQFKCKYTKFSETESYQIGYYWWYVTLFTFAPLILLSIFNSLLISSVWTAHKNRQLLSNTRVVGEAQKNNSEQQRVTTMLISVVLIFILCQTPQAVLLVYRSYLKANRLPLPGDLLKIWGNICNLLVQINASVNFLLYSYFSSKFRRTLKRLLCGWNSHWRRNAFGSLSNTLRSKSSSTTGTTLTSTSSMRSRHLINEELRPGPLRRQNIDDATHLV